MMNRIFLAACLSVAAAGSAKAIGRYTIDHMDCGEVQDILDSDGAAILRYHSPRSGMLLYDRYVANGNWCEHPKVARSSSVPTADTPHCPVLVCKEPVLKYD